MSNAPIAPRPNGQPAHALPDDVFRDGVIADARAVLTEIVGEERGRMAGARVAMALIALSKTQPKIREIGMTDAGRASIINCIAMCALVELLPGGALPGVYIIPRDRRYQAEDGSWQSIGEINFQVGARGLLTLARRAGVQMCAYPVYEGAPVELDDRDRLIIPTIRRTIQRAPEKMIGIIVTAHQLSDGMSLGRFFVESDLIEARRDASDAYQRGIQDTHTQGRKKGQKKTDYELARDRSSPWFEWPEEMAIKTALAYVIRRGYVPVDDVAEHVLRVDAESDRREVFDAEATVVRAAGNPVVRRLTEDLPTRDYIAEAEEAERQREAARVAAAPVGEGTESRTEPPVEPPLFDGLREDVVAWLSALANEIQTDPASIIAFLRGIERDPAGFDEKKLKAASMALSKDGSKRADLLAFIGRASK